MIRDFDKYEVLEPFRENTNTKAALVQAQRLVWEKSLFPKRFPPCSAFLCIECHTKTRDLSICLSCGNIYCGEHFKCHHCSSSKPFGLDILTRQLFIQEKQRGRMFLFDALLDRILVSCKLAIVDGMPFSANLDPNTTILPSIRTPMPLHNLGNTCWLNSTLQCFMANPLLEKWFISQTLPIETPDSAISAVHLLLQKMFLAQNGKSTFSISDLLYCIWALYPDLKSSEQRDSQEFFLRIRESLNSFYTSKYDCTSFNDIFEWKFTVVESCEFCDQTQNKLDPESILILPIITCSSLDEALTQFLTGESPMVCPSCGHSSKKQYYFHTLPQTLTIGLVRTSLENRSISSIKINETLDLAKFVEADQKAVNGMTQYALSSAVVRPRTGETGHFWANVLRSRRWFRCDDASIKATDINEVLHDDVYLLFYVRKGFATPEE